MYKCSVLAPIFYTDPSVSPHIITAHTRTGPHLAKLYTVSTQNQYYKASTSTSHIIPLV